MARKKSPVLTEAELKIMNVIWDKGEATVNELLEAMPEDHGLAYNTVLTTVRIMERKGYVRHTKKGRAHIFLPRITRSQAQSKAVHHMVHSFFDGSPEKLVVSLLENENLSASDITKLKQMIEESEKEKE